MVRPVSVNIIYLLFLIVPGYISLLGYLRARTRLDSYSRLEKLFRTIGFGFGTLGVLLVVRRFELLSFAAQKVEQPFSGEPVTAEIGYNASRAVEFSSSPEFTGLSVVGFILVQSIVGYCGWYLFGTAVYIISDSTGRRDADTEQPWEVAVEQANLGDSVTVVNQQGEVVTGNIYRIGSPSEDYDLLLWGSKRIYPNDSRDPEPLNASYHHYRDIAEIHFPKMRPDESVLEPADDTIQEANSLLRVWKTGRSRLTETGSYLNYRLKYFGLIKARLRDGVRSAHRLAKKLR